MARRIVITGAPGTGKTSLINALGHLGPVVAEPARELIHKHREATGESSLDHRPELFVERLIERSIADFDGTPESGLVFFDRGLPDSIAYAAVTGVDTEPARRAAERRRYDEPVFLCPPWADIYRTDDLRRATFPQVEAFHASLIDAYEGLGYQMTQLPLTSVAERVELVAATLRAMT